MRLLYVVSKTGVKTLLLLTFLLFLVIQPRHDKASAQLNLKGSSKPDINLLRGIQEEQSIQGIFKDAGWIFYPDGKFIFIPSQVNSPRAKLPPISGTYTQFEDRWEFQAEQQSSMFRVSLDGVVIRKNGGDLALEAIYTNSSWQDPRQIAQVTQSLTQQAPGTVKQPVIEQTPVSQPQSDRQPIPDALKKILESSQFESIRVFDVTFEGKTEAGVFSQLPGFLYVTLGKDERLSNVSLLVNPDLRITNGRFQWNTGDLPNPSIQVQGNSSQIQIELKPSKKMGNIAWWTLPTVSSTSADPVIVTGETATAHLSIQGEQVTGEVHARGISGDDQPSTYEAKITGRIQKSQLVEQLRTSLNASGFNGRWSTSNEDTGKVFGQIELALNGQQVSGSFKGQGSGTIEGRVINQNRLEFTWKDNQRGQGKGFLRVIGGTLVGLWSTQDSKTTSPLPLVATWQLPTTIDTKNLSLLDIQYLRKLGHELGSEGRCEQAVSLLEQAFTFYRNKRQQATTSLLDQTWNALLESFSLSSTSMPCNFQLGDYDNLVDNLSHYVNIQLFLKPEASAGRLFRWRTASLAQYLKSSSQHLAIWQNNFTELKKLVSGSHFIGRIGIGLEQDEKTQALIIWKVFKGEPAEKAGILPQDVLIGIDGHSTQGVNIDQVLEKLRGAPDTPVTVTVRRGTQEIDFKLARGQVEVYPVARQAEFIQALTFRINYLANLQARLKTQLDQLADIETKISQGKAEPVQAWIALTETLKNQKTQLDTETDDLIAQRMILFKGQTVLMQDSDAILQAIPRACNLSQFNEVNMSQVRDLDKHIEQTLENSRDLTLAEKTLFNADINLAAALYTLSTKLDCEYKLLVQTDAKKQFEDNKRQATDIANQMDRYIERWRIKLVDDAKKIDTLDKGQPFFQKLISLLIELDDKKGALVTSEKSRARAFADLLATRLSTNSAQTSAESPTLEQIQQIAKTQAATLVQYSIIDNAGKEPELFIWVIQPTGEVNFKRVSLKSLEQQKATLNDSAEKMTPLEYLIANTRKAVLDQLLDSQANPTPYLQQLHQLLIQPISELLPSNPNAHIIFIPQKELFLVPFPALLDAKGKYLIQKHTILTAPSIQALDSTHRLRQQNAGFSKQNLVVGNPIYARKNLDNLPNWEQGAKEIATQLNTQAIIGRDATRSTILKLLPQAQIIHLATHSGFDGEHPLKSWIALTPERSNVNGEITAGDLLDLYAPPKGSPLHAELIVLAACETGQGQITGDGVNGLSRSLIAAGIPSAVVSLWPVNEVPTIFLMKEFYKDLPSGKAQALRQAMLATMKEYPKQIGAWAGFTLIGEAD
ncbi:MAG TPA: CHAT domain-containing protein [Stenomitos sp.]